MSWPAGAKKPTTRQLNDLTGTRALAGSMRDVGIADDFITIVRDQVTLVEVFAE